MGGGSLAGGGAVVEFSHLQSTRKSGNRAKKLWADSKGPVYTAVGAAGGGGGSLFLPPSLPQGGCLRIDFQCPRRKGGRERKKMYRSTGDFGGEV